MKTETWLQKFSFELESRGLGPKRRSEVVVETAGFIDESGTEPLEQFGFPSDYAASVISALGETTNPSPPDNPTIMSANQLSKSYRSSSVLSQIDIDLREGQILALIGPNGSGKTTLLKILAGMIQPDHGTVTTSASIGYCPQIGGINPNLRPTEHLQLFGAGFGLDKDQATAEGKRLAGQLDWEITDRMTASELSGGTAQKLSLILAMLGRPDLLLLDEPYQGFDNKSAQRFWELLWTWRDNGGAAIVSSHSEDVLIRADQILELEPTS